MHQDLRELLRSVSKHVYSLVDNGSPKVDGCEGCGRASAEQLYEIAKSAFLRNRGGYKIFVHRLACISGHIDLHNLRRPGTFSNRNEKAV